MNSLLDDEYGKLQSSCLTASGKSNILNNIIQYKLSEPSFINHRQNFSVDIKDYLNSLIYQAEQASVGYDLIKVNNIDDLLKSIDSDQRIVYVDYFIRQLQKSSFNSEIRDFQKLRTKIIIETIISRKRIYKVKSIVSLFVYIPLYNWVSLFATIFLIGILIAIILFPAPYKFMQLLNFEITYQHISQSYVVNHILNILGSFVGISTEFKLVPRDSLTMVIYIYAKIICYLYIVSFLLNKLGEFIKEK